MTHPQLHRSATNVDLLLLHGWGGDADSHWRDLQFLLNDSYGTAAYDLPGFGESEALLTDSNGWSVEEGCDTLDGVIDTLGHPVAVVGSSLGGIIALRAASRPGNRISHVVAIGAGPRFINSGDYPYGFDVAAAADMVATLQRDFSAFKGVVRSFHLNDDDRHAAERCATRIDSVIDRVRDPEKPIGVHLGLTRSDLRPSLPLIRVPVLLIYGERDQVFGPAVRNLMVSSIPGATLVEIRGAGHLPHMTQPMNVAQAILAFLRRPASEWGDDEFRRTRRNA